MEVLGDWRTRVQLIIPVQSGKKQLAATEITSQ